MDVQGEPGIDSGARQPLGGSNAHLSQCNRPAVRRSITNRFASQAARRRTFAQRSAVIPSSAESPRSSLMSWITVSGSELLAAISISSSMAIHDLVAHPADMVSVSRLIDRRAGRSGSLCNSRKNIREVPGHGRLIKHALTTAATRADEKPCAGAS
jgi:hypothetical protein